MPHMNVLDISVFAAISLRHIHLIWSLREMQFSKEDGIYEISAKVWEELLRRHNYAVLSNDNVSLD